MKIRYINIEKYNQKWFRSLSARTKFFYEYMFNKVDNAGFLDIIPDQIELDINLKQNDQEKAIHELHNRIVISDNKDTIYLKDFLEVQKNLPLNHNNKAHLNILRIFADRLRDFKSGIEYFAEVKCHHIKTIKKEKDNERKAVENKEENLLDTLKWLIPSHKSFYQTIEAKS